MESWKLVWRSGFAPVLSDAALAALRTGLEADDPRIVQGCTTTPPPLMCVQDWAVEAACPLGYAGWHGDDLTTVGETEEHFAKCCFEADQRLGEPAACRWWLNWWDDTPRNEAFREMAAEVRREIFRRRLAGVIREDAIDRWLDTVNPNPTFGGRAPADLIRANEMEPLEQMIYQIESGVAS